MKTYSSRKIDPNGPLQLYEGSNPILQYSNTPPSHYYIILIASCIIIFLLRSHTFHEPLEADEAILAIIAQDWIEGGKPTITLWENKPVGSYIIYRFAIEIFGFKSVITLRDAFFSYGLSSLKLNSIEIPASARYG